MNKAVFFDRDGVITQEPPHYAHRIDCDCRRPKPEMLKQTEKDLNSDLKQSFLVGEKISDIEVVYRAGCKTILVLTGHGNDELKKNANMNIKPDYISKDLYSASQIINKI